MFASDTIPTQLTYLVSPIRKLNQKCLQASISGITVVDGATSRYFLCGLVLYDGRRLLYVGMKHLNAS
jgi:hypothetical protein